MSLGDLAIAVDWAAAEGWNPGLDDAATFHATDPGGFLMGWLGAEPVTAISVIRHSADFGFLGFYLCRPGYRGRGFGWATWQQGIAALGTRVIGLDGVVAQQENYARSGFAMAHESQRWGGVVTGRPHPGIEPVAASDLPDLLALDRRISGLERDRYLTGWFTETPTRRTMLCRSSGGITAAGTIRACRDGHKIGPLFAETATSARQMIDALVDGAGASQIFIDLPGPNKAGSTIASDLGLTPSFACARMYRGTAPIRQLGMIYGETSFELG